VIISPVNNPSVVNNYDSVVGLKFYQIFVLVIVLRAFKVITVSVIYHSDYILTPNGWYIWTITTSSSSVTTMSPSNSGISNGLLLMAGYCDMYMFPRIMTIITKTAYFPSKLIY